MVRLVTRCIPLLALLSLLPASLSAQQTGTIQGTIVEAGTQRPLEAAQVWVSGLQLNTLADVRGRFLLVNVPVGTHEVQVQTLGFATTSQTVTVPAGGTVRADFQLQPAAIALDELVVTGVAGETPRVKVPFVVEKVSAAQMPVPAISGVGTMIQGKVAGVQIVSGSGMPGEEASILLRGPSSILGSTDPLLIVDGIILAASSVDLEALDIESVEVVKGAAAASLYGSRAASGVIQITTRRGRDMALDQNRFTLRTEYGASQLERRISLARNHPFRMNAAGTAFIDDDGSEVGYGDAIFAGADASRTFQDGAYPMPTYDHIGRFFQPGHSLTTYAAAEGRSGRINYHASFGNVRDQGVVYGHDGYRRQNARLNLDYGLGEPISLSLTGAFTRSHQDDIDANERTGPFGRLSFMAPVADLLERDPETGRVLVDPDPRGSALNPLYGVLYADLFNERQRVLGGGTLRIAPLSWFSVEGNVSFDRTDRRRVDYTPRGYETGDGEQSSGSLIMRDNFVEGINGSLTLAINRSFGELNTRVRLRYLTEDEKYSYLSAEGQNLVVEDIRSLSAATAGLRVNSEETTIRSEGFFLISDFDLRDRYVASLLVRRDGSSLFGPDNRWHTYYRLSGAYRMAQEEWWPFADITEFKPRYSIGTAGGRPRFAAQYETYSIGSGGVLSPRTLGNRDLRPEHSTEQEVGLDMSIRDRVALGVTYAHSVNKEQLLEIPLSAYAGFDTQWRNAGTIESRTWEASLDAMLVNQPALAWSARLNLDRTRQEITHFPRSELRYGPFSAFYFREGEALGTFYGYRWVTSCAELPGADCSQFQKNDDGYLVWVGAGNNWQEGVSKDLWGTSGAVNGQSYNWGMPIRYADAAGEEFFVLGNAQPDFSMGLGNTVRWRNLTLYGLLQGEFGTDVYNMTRQWAMRDYRHGEVDQAGKPETHKKPLGYYDRLYNLRDINSHFVEDGSYVKLREVSLRYALGRDQLERWFGGWGGNVERVTLSLTGRNLKTWTNYSGYDPEVGGSALSRFDNYYYPNFRSYRAMVEVVF
jgi:TonB-linked SusC/RagA family outer membrane protein